MNEQIGFSQEKSMFVEHVASHPDGIDLIGLLLFGQQNELTNLELALKIAEEEGLITYKEEEDKYFPVSETS